MQFLLVLVSASVDMIFRYRFQYRYWLIRKSKISVVIGISRYYKKLIGRFLGLCMIPSETLHNLPHFWNTKIQVVGT